MVAEPAAGEVWWGEVPDTTPRPYLVITRDVAIPVLRRVLVAPVTRSIRGIPTEVPLGPEEGMPVECVASFDNVVTIAKVMLVRRMGTLGPGRRGEPCDAIRAAMDC